MTNTSYYMGPIHPRIKKPVGDRLATAAMGVVFGSSGAYAGPTLAGAHFLHLIPKFPSICVYKMGFLCNEMHQIDRLHGYG
jgi:hypothetical protein